MKLLGNITTQTINGYPVDQIKEIMRNPINKAEENMILTTSNMSHKLEYMIQSALPHLECKLQVTVQ